jgi:hypothetical protein
MKQFHLNINRDLLYVFVTTATFSLNCTWTSINLLSARRRLLEVGPIIGCGDVPSLDKVLDPVRSAICESDHVILSWSSNCLVAWNFLMFGSKTWCAVCLEICNISAALSCWE